MLTIGVFLSTDVAVADPRALGDHARHVEASGLDAVFTGDHLVTARPFLDSAIVLSTAAAATRRIRLGFGVMLPALRPTAWAAKQIAGLQQVSGDRVVLGVGAGGTGHGTAGWTAAGVPVEARGRRTDDALAQLPDLVAGRPVEIGGEQVVLAPGAVMPPVWVGGTSGAARRRAVRHGDTWFPSMVTLDEVTTGLARLRDACDEAGRSVPAVAVGGLVHVDEPGDRADPATLAAAVASNYGIDADRAGAIPMVGPPAAVAARFAALAEAGATALVLNAVGEDWRRQVELIRQARTLAGV